MMRILLDTSAYSHLMCGNRNIATLLDQADEVLLSAIVVGELRAGFKNGSKERQNKAVLQDFLSVINVSVLSIDGDTAERYSVIFDYLKKAGNPIPINDIWIAASAMQHGLVLVTSDQHFSVLPQIVSEIVSGAC